jgi:leader peptidase (prepilin peptidase)/N-methyltransferase
MITALIALIGLIFGSFLNVVICRLPEGQSILRPRSHCMACGTPIRPYDNIPVISWVLLRGRCRKCRASVSWQYPAVEILTALIFTGLYLTRSDWGSLVTGCVLALFLIPISVIDIKKRLILNRLTVPGFILGLLLVAGFHYANWREVIFNHLLLGSVAAGMVMLAISLLGRVIFRKESMGMGDLKLLVMIGIYVGFPDVFLCLFYGLLAAFVWIVGAMLLRKLKLGSTISFGPFIALGTLVQLLAGDNILAWYRNSILS